MKQTWRLHKERILMDSCIRGTGNYYKRIRDQYPTMPSSLERRHRIVQYVRYHDNCHVEDLCNYIGVSRSVILNDLKELSKQGLISTKKRRYGGIRYGSGAVT